MSYLNRHIDGSEQRLRARMKKSFDRIVKACKLSAEPAYSKWLYNKINTYFPEHTWVDEPTATAWAIKHIPNFEVLVQIIVAAHFQSWFGQWIGPQKVQSPQLQDVTDFEF